MLFYPFSLPSATTMLAKLAGGLDWGGCRNPCYDSANLWYSREKHHCQPWLTVVLFSANKYLRRDCSLFANTYSWVNDFEGKQVPRRKKSLRNPDSSKLLCLQTQRTWVMQMGHPKTHANCLGMKLALWDPEAVSNTGGPPVGAPRTQRNYHFCNN